MSLLTWLGRILLNTLRLLGLNWRDASLALEDHSSVNVVVRTNDGRSVQLTLHRSWTMAQVRTQLAGSLNRPERHVKIILAGTALADQVKVEDCDLGPSTILHAIIVKVQSDEDEQQQRNTEVSSPDRRRPLNQSLTEWSTPSGQSTTTSSSSSGRAHFFVFCSAPCESLSPAKLRVRCSQCGEGSIILDREPQGWNDVTKPDQIQGRCQSQECGGDRVASAEFFFKCCAHEDSSPSPPLTMVRPNADLVPCLACMDDGDPVVAFDCADRHVVCVDCFAAYCLSKLGERAFILDDELGYTLGCPAGCEESLIRETRHFKLALKGEEYERYQRFGAEESVLKAGGVLCPQPGCGMGILPEGGETEALSRRVACKGGCEYVFCRDCLQGYHLGECIALGSTSPPSSQPSSLTLDPSSLSRRWRMHAGDASASALAIRLTTKPCPKCRAPTERSGGCMHMICTKSACGFHWCWVCQGEWTRECMAAHWFG